MHRRGCQAGSESGGAGLLVGKLAGKGRGPLTGPTYFWLLTSPSLPRSTSDFPQPQAAPNGSSDIRFYLTVYATIAGVNSLCTFLRAVLFAAGTLRAAATLHRRLLCRVLMVRGWEGGGGMGQPSQSLGAIGGPILPPSLRK